MFPATVAFSQKYRPYGICGAFGLSDHGFCEESEGERDLRWRKKTAERPRKGITVLTIMAVDKRVKPRAFRPRHPKHAQNPHWKTPEMFYHLTQFQRPKKRTRRLPVPVSGPRERNTVARARSRYYYEACACRTVRVSNNSSRNSLINSEWRSPLVYCAPSVHYNFLVRFSCTYTHRVRSWKLLLNIESSGGGGYVDCINPDTYFPWN